MLKFPPPKEIQRIQDYEIYEKMFFGDHFEAFNVKTSGEFKKEFKKLNNLRYVMCNFAGMISKLSADMLFEEFPKITMAGNDDFIQALIEDNDLKTQLYESGLENSYRGDAIFRIRAEDSEVVIEDLSPTIYFPEYDENNVRKEPKAHVLAWKVSLGVVDGMTGKSKQGLFVEKHTAGQIEYHLYEIDPSGNVLGEYPVNEFYPGLNPVEQTNVDDPLIIHIPNYRVNSCFFGISDYKDLMQLMVAIENRMTKVDNILDRHGDPILAVPEGVLDEEGKVSRQSFGVIEVPTDGASGAKPEYIVWDANLDSAFKEIDKLVDFLFMTSETSQAAFGIDKGGAADSGRALKFKLLRTIAKKHRKELYFDVGIKRLLKLACEFAKANNFTADGEVKISGEIGKVQIEWQDGVMNDALETLEVEQMKQSMSITSDLDIIMRTEGLSEKEAQKKLDTIQKENAAKKPAFSAIPVTTVPGAGGQAKPPKVTNDGNAPASVDDTSVTN